MSELNEAIREMADDLQPPCYGWYWRDVDWDSDSVTLAVAPNDPPSWYNETVEARFLNQTYNYGGSVRFCENNKWGYAMFRVEGDDWTKLREMVRAHVEEPTRESLVALTAYMNDLAPEGLADEPDAFSEIG